MRYGIRKTRFIYFPKQKTDKYVKLETKNH